MKLINQKIREHLNGIPQKFDEFEISELINHCQNLSTIAAEAKDLASDLSDDLASLQKAFTKSDKHLSDLEKLVFYNINENAFPARFHNLVKVKLKEAKEELQEIDIQDLRDNTSKIYDFLEDSDFEL